MHAVCRLLERATVPRRRKGQVAMSVGGLRQERGPGEAMYGEARHHVAGGVSAFDCVASTGGGRALRLTQPCAHKLSDCIGFP